MIRLLALWAIVVSGAILVVIIREERLIQQGKVPLGRLRRLWFRSDRRRAPRYRLDWPVRYQRMGIPPPAAAQTRDVSQTGVGIVLKERFEIGADLSLSFTVPGRTEPLAVTGKIMWTRQIPSRWESPPSERLFAAGVHFYDVDSETSRLLASILGAKSSSIVDRRQ